MIDLAERALILVAAGAVGAGAYALLRVSRGWGSSFPARLDIDELDLALMPGCCAFVVFTTPTCRPCKAALRAVRLAAAGASESAAVRVVDAVARHDLAGRSRVRTVPTVFLITASGHVLDRWQGVPDPAQLAEALRVVDDRAPAPPLGIPAPR